jgi:lipopolysaccharide transport system permease protein
MLRDVLSHLRLIRRLAVTELRARYWGSALGLVWAVVQPLTMIVLYTLIFAVVLKVKVGVRGSVTDFGLFLICGMLPFNAVADAIRRSSTVYVDQAHLLRRIAVPPIVLPASRVLLALAEQALALVLLLLLITILGRPPRVAVCGVLLLAPLQLALTFGLAVAIASLAALVRDVATLAEPLLTIWFLGTPVFYPRDVLPDWLRPLIDANPLTPLVEGYRTLILGGGFPPLADWLYLGAIAAFALAAGHWVYRRTRPIIVDYV